MSGMQMVASLGLNYANFMAGLAGSRNGMQSWSSGTANLLAVTSGLAANTITGIGRTATGATRAAGNAVGSVLRGTGAMAQGFGQFGQSAAGAFSTWRANSARMKTELIQQQAILQQQKQSAVGAISGLSILTVGLGTALGSVFNRVANSISSIPSMGIKLAMDAEQTQIAFETMLGSVDQAKLMLGELKAYADKSPFNIQGVNEAAKKLLNYSVQAQDVLPTMRMLGDVAAGDMEKFDRLSTAFGQMSSTGRLMGQDLLQFINAGFNPLQEISKKTGESMADLKKRMEEGGISAFAVRDAFIAATSEGGRFYNMTDRQSSTIAGKWSTLKDSVSTSLRGIGEALITNLDMSGWLDYLTGWTNRVPFLFANAGNLLKLEMINWNIYLMEIIPGAESVVTSVGQVFQAGWDAMGASYHKFVDSVKAGFVEIGNVAQAAGAAIAGTGKGWWETTKSWATLGMMGEKGSANPLSMFAKGGAAFTETLAKQPDAMKPGEDFASTFGKEFTASMDKQKAAAKLAPSLTDSLKASRDEMLGELAWDKALAPRVGGKADFGGKLGDSFNKDTKKEDEDKAARKAATSNAALKGSQEAAKIITRGVGGGDAVAKKQLTALEKIVTNTDPRTKPVTSGMDLPNLDLMLASF